VRAFTADTLIPGPPQAISLAEVAGELLLSVRPT